MIDLQSYLLLKEIGAVTGRRFTDLLSTVKNPATLSSKLKSLTAFGLVSNENGFYTVSEKGVKALKPLGTVVSILKEEIKVMVEKVPHKFFSSLLERYCYLLHDEFKDRLTGVALFGSVARGAWNKDSDIDLLIIVEDWKKPTWERTKQLLQVRQRLRETSEYAVCLKNGFVPAIQHYPLDLEEAKTPHRLYLDLCIDGIVLYEKDEFMTSLIANFRERIRKLGGRRVTVPGKGFYWQFPRVRAGESFSIC